MFLSLLRLFHTFMTPTYMDRANGMGRRLCVLITLIPKYDQTAYVCIVSNPQSPIHTMNREIVPDSYADLACVDSAILLSLQNL